jgi:CRP-like cAMP-binding protein
MIFDTIPTAWSRDNIGQMLETLAEISFFEGLTPRQLELIRPFFEYYRCPANTVVFQQGDKAVFLYLIVKGNALIQYKPYDGPSITLSRLKAGDAFGWSAAIGSPTYSSAILSTEPMEAVRIRGIDLVHLCREHPNTGSIILNRLAHGVSGRWKDARVQIKTMLKDGVEHSIENSAEA